MQDSSPISKLLRLSLTPIRDTERVTEVDAFPNLSAPQQNTLELGIDMDYTIIVRHCLGGFYGIWKTDGL